MNANRTNMTHARITARVSPQVEEKLKQAAELTSSTVNQFIVQAALEKAELILQRELGIKITEADAAILLKLIDNPSTPNPELLQAFKKVFNG